jgi:hypothetical protein
VNAPFHGLTERIRQKLVELDQVVTRLSEAWQRAHRSGDNFYLDSVALNLHGFYSGLERIFERLAETLDGSLPKGKNWHRALLVQMSNEVTGIRPAVISQQTLKRLDEYRGFRHVVRNVYTFHFDEAKLEKLVMGAGDVFAQARAEIFAFVDFLDAQE